MVAETSNGVERMDGIDVAERMDRTGVESPSPSPSSNFILNLDEDAIA